ncbi:MAG: DUF1223 domain-containing protein [Rhodothermaceae bacterium]|nr:DUF1223 domain-containing protein [Rhodothermaceae bacterium]
MKIIPVLILAAFALTMSTIGLLAASTAPVQIPPASSPPTEPVMLRLAEPVAVVELFTSEGCSSCPKADRLLVELAERDDPRLLPIAFHVDYWNRLGWTDPFSDATYSQRQRAYARTFQSGRVYTPQMIVNGRREFVGSRRHEAQAAIRQALTQSAPAIISLLVTADEEHMLTVAYDVEDAPEGTVLNIALVQRRAVQGVPRGENAGKTLEHANVVRAFETVPTDAGTQSLAMPDELNLDEIAVVAYVQDPETMQMYGAGQTTVR